MRRMEIRNAVLKSRFDSRSRWFQEVNALFAHWNVYKAFVPGGSFGVPVMGWR